MISQSQVGQLCFRTSKASHSRRQHQNLVLLVLVFRFMLDSRSGRMRTLLLSRLVYSVMTHVDAVSYAESSYYNVFELPRTNCNVILGGQSD